VGPDAEPGANPGELERILAEVIADTLGRSAADIAPERAFVEYGVDSIIMVKLVDAVNQRLNVTLKPTVLFDHPSLRQLAQCIADSRAARAGELSSTRTSPRRPPPGPRVADAPSGAPAPCLRAANDGRDVERQLGRVLAGVLGRSSSDIDPERSFTEYGIDSVILVEVVSAINRELGITLKPTALFDHPTLSQLASHVASCSGEDARQSVQPAPTRERSAEAEQISTLRRLASREISVEAAIQMLGSSHE
jgi:acyl carrier protein